MVMEKRRNYNDYKEYLEHQAKKTLYPGVRDYLIKHFDQKVKLFRVRFDKIEKGIIKSGDKALCLGARMGEEVAALREMGLDAIGIDIVPNLPLVIEGDFNNLKFNPESFDLVYTNAFDHAWDIQPFLSQVHRVLKTGGIFILDIFLKNFKNCEVIYFENTDDIVKYIEDKFKMKLLSINSNLPKLYRRHRGENKEKQLIFQK